MLFVVALGTQLSAQDVTRPSSFAVRPAETVAPQEGADRVMPWQSLARIRVSSPTAGGDGSGVIIYSNSEETIVLTAAHLLPDDATKVIVDFFDGVLIREQKVGPGTVAYERSAVGTFFEIDRQSDLALVRTKPGVILPASPVVALGWKFSPKEQMLAAGCDLGVKPSIFSTHIRRLIFRDVDRPDMFLSEYSAYVADYAPKPGRSGGGLFTLNGYLVGVCQFTEPGENMGWYSSNGLLRRFLLNSYYAFLVQDRL